MTRQRVVIVGGGFAGLAIAKKLAGKPVDVILLNRENYHTFSPLLHQVATSAIAPSNIVYSLRRGVGKAKNISTLTADVTQIDVHSQLVKTKDTAIAYDYLVIACGSQTHYAQTIGAQKHAFALKNFADALRLRNQILSCFEQAQIQTHKSHISQLLTFCVVGGGVTGVEIAAELADWIHFSVRKDYPQLDFRRVRIVMLHKGEQILPEVSRKNAEYARRELQIQGVEIRFNAQASKVTSDALHLSDGRVIPTKTVIWTAGVQNHPCLETWGLNSKHASPPILPTLQFVDRDNLYLIGDIVAPYLKLPRVASAAIAQGEQTGENILRQIKGRHPQPFKYKYPGTMVVLGRKAIADIGKVRLHGLIAWILWLEVHWLCLPGKRNKLYVLINWIFSYILRDRPIKVILASPAISQKTNDGAKNGTNETIPSILPDEVLIDKYIDSYKHIPNT